MDIWGACLVQHRPVGGIQPGTHSCPGAATGRARPEGALAAAQLMSPVQSITHTTTAHEPSAPERLRQRVRVSVGEPVRVVRIRACCSGLCAHAFVLLCVFELVHLLAHALAGVRFDVFDVLNPNPIPNAKP